MKTLLLIALVFGPLPALAEPWWLKGVASNGNDFLAPDAAFAVSARIDGNWVRIHWDIAPGYYLYRSKFAFVPESPGLNLEAAVFTPGSVITDQYLGVQETYHARADAVVGFTRNDAGAHPLQIKVSYQGCAQAGLCYPLMTKVLSPGAVTLAPAPSPAQPAPGVIVAIVGGFALFFIAGLLMRRARNFDVPAS